METFEPLINLLVLLTVLSITSERITNIIKLRNKDIASRRTTEGDEKDRELDISLRSIMVGIGLAVIMKANLFEILANMTEPWETMGWVKIDGETWSRALAGEGFGSFLYTLAGCTLTGVGLGFGSKFWHDILDSTNDLKNRLRGITTPLPAGGGEKAITDEMIEEFTEKAEKRAAIERKSAKATLTSRKRKASQ